MALLISISIWLLVHLTSNWSASITWLVSIIAGLIFYMTRNRISLEEKYKGVKNEKEKRSLQAAGFKDHAGNSNYTTKKNRQHTIDKSKFRKLIVQGEIEDSF